ncbi:MAG TPA: DUF4349 domain-containing protein [Candidatus Magasanikbacteria bacterium]|jgi:hypothetical protein|nr:DUF4349 domain-containing protein [Candidatus Magasanikbacteria bacterium]HQF57510.1 DUF4349 domain-containing protein [Candidatus Magasanikbacteria bacterium]HQL52381.1 DUF4349 domain-containing protein [Candidatus Magasanikbacteria bacterium]
MSKKIKIILGIVILAIVLILFSATTLWQTKTKSSSLISQNLMLKNGIAVGRNSDSYKTIQSVASDSIMVTEESIKSSVNKNERMIIKTGSLSMVVKDVNEVIVGITKYATDNGGFVVYSNIYKSGIAPTGEVTVRIPVNVFDTGIDEIKKMGEIKSESVNGQDVTEEYVDLDLQLKNLRAAENQFLQIMNRAVKIEDVLAVQRELTNVRGQIESIQGRMKYLSQSVELSTLTVYLSTDPNELPTLNPEDKWKPWAQVKDAARSLIAVSKSLVNLIIWLVVFLPVWLIIFGLVWLGKRWWKNRK